MLPQAVLFDLDDTLLEDDKAAENAWEKTAVVFALKTRLFSKDEFAARVNYIRKHSWSDARKTSLDTKGKIDFFHTRTIIVKKALDELGCNYEDRTINEIVRTFADIKLELAKYVEGAENTLHELSKRGIKLALLTNGEADEQRKKIKKLGVEKFFSVCLVEGELGHGKPDSRIFEMALNLLGVNKNQVWMVGDRLEYDILGSQRMGIFSVWCDYGKTGLPAGSAIKPDRIINNISELLIE
jgi:putative hydrolase of the HAD superfamily